MSGTEYTKFAVAATTRIPSVGSLCPFTSRNGAVAVQGRTNVGVGTEVISRLDAGGAIEDVVPSVLDDVRERNEMQVHGVGNNGECTVTGPDCIEWAGSIQQSGLTVAGNGMVSREVVAAVAETFNETQSNGTPLIERLIDAIAAGHELDDQERDILPVQSAVVDIALQHPEMTVTPNPLHSLRVDASETPLKDLRETYETAVRGLEQYKKIKSHGDRPTYL